MRVNDDGLEIDVLWIVGIDVESVDNTISTIDDGAKELWEIPQMFYKPKNIDPRLLKEARDNECSKLEEFKAFEWIPTFTCAGGEWIASRWEDRIKPDGAVRASESLPTTTATTSSSALRRQVRRRRSLTSTPSDVDMKFATST